MVETTWRYGWGKLILVSRLFDYFGDFRAIFSPFWGPFLDRKEFRHLGDCAKQGEPIRTTKGSLKSLFGSQQNDTGLVENGSGDFETWAGQHPVGGGGGGWARHGVSRYGGRPKTVATVQLAKQHQV